MAQSFGAELKPIDLRDASEIERAVSTSARSPNGGLIATVSAAALRHRELIVTLAAQHRLPTVSGLKEMVEAGGLMAYGGNFAELYRRAANHVHKILQGMSPADLPVEQATKFELVLNLKTARALGLEVPPMLLARADEVIE